MVVSLPDLSVINWELVVILICYNFEDIDHFLMLQFLFVYLYLCVGVYNYE